MTPTDPVTSGTAVQATPTAVEARRVTIAYGEHVAVRDVSFDLPAGAVTAIIGPNGSGKTTLLRALSGLEPVDAGTLSVLGRPAAPGRREVAHVLQATRINDQVPLTVREVVCMARYAHRGPLRRFGRTDQAAVERAMERMEVGDLAHRHLRELSGGQRQRVYVAQGLAQQARLLLLDEPITGLDIVSQERITTVVNEEVAAGATVVVTTHDVASAGQADHVLLIATRLVAAGAPAGVLTAANLRTAYGGEVYRTDEGTVVLGDPHHHGLGLPADATPRRDDTRP